MLKGRAWGLRAMSEHFSWSGAEPTAAAAAALCRCPCRLSSPPSLALLTLALPLHRLGSCVCG
jgi:hypothetical protein